MRQELELKMMLLLEEAGMMEPELEERAMEIVDLMCDEFDKEVKVFADFAYSEGYDDGFTVGQSKGYDTGYENGYEEAMSK